MKHFAFKRSQGQSTIEFTFSMICVTLLIVGMIKIFTWTGRDLVERRQQHDAVLTEAVCSASDCVLRQVRPMFFTEVDLNIGIASNIFGPQYTMP
ncbi:MAG: hypothetical protein KAJ18_06365 [Candidatus Omnitrophica bacterium]|nr:hypothetical protein [Candidatus Omnitrophota bacterium]